MTIRILTIDDDDINLKLVVAALSRHGYEVLTARGGYEGLRRVVEIKPDLILLDLMMPDMDGFEVCSRLRRLALTAHTPIMMLTSVTTVEDKIKSFDAGADDYLPKPFAADELAARVKVLLRRATPSTHVAADEPQGKVIAVFSLRGGVGVSTLATNLAAGLTTLWDSPAVLVDLSLASGQAALMLNLPFRHSWLELTDFELEEIDADLVDQVLLRHSSGTHVLAAPSRTEEIERITPEIVHRVLGVLKKRFAHVVLDLGHDFQATTLAALDNSDPIMAVLAPELASLRSMVGALRVFKALNYPPERIHMVLNSTFQRNGLLRKDIETALHHPVRMVIPFTPDALVTAINLGNPPVLSDPESPIGALFEDLSFLTSLELLREKQPRSPTDAWKRVNQRMQSRQAK
jgi:pilus assembly protein CpaE